MFRTVFKESDGQWSMRRVLAFLFALASIGCGITSLILKAVWQVIACAFGIPGIISIILLFFTTWTDVSTVVNAVKGK
jgi:TM2 domain-containing membrane protein YozV